MKKLFLSLSLLTATLTPAFAQDYLSCNFKILDNKVDCPWFGGCPQKKLITSKNQFLIGVNEGETVKGKINFKKIIVKPGTDAEKENQIIVFSEDYLPEKLKNEEKAEFAIFKTKSGISYQITKFGASMDIIFKTNNYTLNINLTGDSHYSDYIMSDKNSISVICEKISKDVYEDRITEKNELQRYENEKEAAKANKE